MQTGKGFGGLDRFRLAAALLVAAIHTSPLASFSQTGDFLLTRVAARVAVPFFFMATGYFTFGPGRGEPGELVGRRVKKTLLLYGAAIFLYLPLGLYAGHYKGLGLTGAVRLLAFDGTFYHLWYLPAMALGLWIVYGLGSFLPMGAVGLVTVLLYAVGLGGDSYYGLAMKSAVLRQAYGAGFTLFSYTRNGLFFAPLFLFLGGWLAEQEKKPGGIGGIGGIGRVGRTGYALGRRDGRAAGEAGQKAFCWAGLAASMALMAAEALALRAAGWQRHDSMYVMLPVCMVFLFRLLLLGGGRARPALRTLSASVYILHPLMIVAVRGIGRLPGLWDVLVENSLGHYAAVCLSSLAVSAVLAGMAGEVKRRWKARRRI